MEAGVLRGLSVHTALTRHDGRSRDEVCSRREEDGRHLSERWGFAGRRGDQHRGHVEEQDATAFQAGARRDVGTGWAAADAGPPEEPGLLWIGKGRDALEKPEDVRSCWGGAPRSPAGEFRN